MLWINQVFWLDLETLGTRLILIQTLFRTVCSGVVDVTMPALVAFTSLQNRQMM